jgi:glycosyltransferase involved in cell wall biosynthesis
MKILLVNSTDKGGGAAIAANRLQKALLGVGVNSSLLVQQKKSQDTDIIGPSSKFAKLHSILRPLIDRLPLKRYPNRTKTYYSVSWCPFSGIVEKINQLEPDIVHLHWINNGMIRIEDLKRIKAPIVWTLHDMWPFTGGCHVDGGCGKYTKVCGDCPVLKSGKEFDLSNKIFTRKLKTYKNLDVTIVGLSRWLKNCAQNSFLFQKKRIVNLPNPINTDFFKPVSKVVAKEILNLPKNKKLVLFGAFNPLGDSNKGSKKLTEAFKKVSEKDLIELMIFGSTRPLVESEFDFPTHYMGRINDELSLRILYSAADVMVVPSLQEAFGQTASEAMSCGTPVVAFAATGLLDIVDHKKNGYLAEPYDPSDLAKGIDWVIKHKNHQQLCQNAREKILKKFDSKVVAKQYIALYNEILATQNHK